MRPRGFLCGPFHLRRLGVLGFALLAACGDPVVPGEGRLEGAVLVLSGPPRGLGEWQGRAARAEVLAARSALLRAYFGDEVRGPDLRTASEIYVSQTLRLLPERLRQELQGLGEASGLGEAAVLLPDVAREGLRWHAGASRLLGGAVEASADGTAATWRPDGPDAALLLGSFLLVDRRPEGRRRTVLVAAPGSLGGFAGASDSGLAAVAVETEAAVERQSLRGPPFGASLRLALEEAADGRDLAERLARTTAHRVVVLDPARHAAWRVDVDAIEVVVEPVAPGAGPDAAAPVALRWADGAFEVVLGDAAGRARAAVRLR